MASLVEPGLIPTVITRGDERRTALASPRRGPTLREHFEEFRAGGLPGLPREELLDCLYDAAETLDALWEARETAHLALSPDRLQIAGERVLVAEFGLAALVWLPAGLSLARGNPRYAAPELWDNEVTRNCDSYSLALIYQEMLTGRHPLENGTPEANLSPLPPADRPVLARALDPTPDVRFATCTELIDALECAGRDEAAGASAPDRMIRAVLDDAAGSWQLREYGPVCAFILPGCCLRHTFVARLPADPAGAVRDGLTEHGPVRVIVASSDAIECRVQMTADGWRRLVGRPGGFTINARLFPRPSLPPDYREVSVEVRPFGMSADRLEETGPKLLDALRAALQADPERRGGDRFDCYRTVTVGPCGGATLQARVKDVSRTGIGLYVPCRPDSDQLNVYLSPGAGVPTVGVAVHVVRVEPCGEGFEIGGRFLIG
jgi:hypothetical protein